MAERFTLGERVKLERFSAFRSVSPLYRDGELIGFLVVNTGWGQSWKLSALAEGAYTEGFGPGATVRYYGSGGRKEILAALNAGTLNLPEDKFLTASELRAARKSERERAIESLTETIGRLSRILAQINVHAYVLQEILREQVSEHVSKQRELALAASIVHWEDEAKSTQRALDRVQIELRDLQPKEVA